MNDIKSRIKLIPRFKRKRYWLVYLLIHFLLYLSANFLSVFIHETAHAITGICLGGRVVSYLVTPFWGSVSIQAIDWPGEAFLFAIAGSFVSILAGIVAVIVFFIQNREYIGYFPSLKKNFVPIETHGENRPVNTLSTIFYWEKWFIFWYLVSTLMHETWYYSFGTLVTSINDWENDPIIMIWALRDMGLINDLLGFKQVFGTSMFIIYIIAFLFTIACAKWTWKIYHQEQKFKGFISVFFVLYSIQFILSMVRFGLI